MRKRFPWQILFLLFAKRCSLPQKPFCEVYVYFTILLTILNLPFFLYTQSLSLLLSDWCWCPFLRFPLSIFPRIIVILSNEKHHCLSKNLQLNTQLRFHFYQEDTMSTNDWSLCMLKKASSPAQKTVSCPVPSGRRHEITLVKR